MLQKIITSAVAVVVLGLTPLAAAAEPDGEVTNALLATLYGPAGATRQQDATQRFYADRAYQTAWWRGEAWSDETHRALAVLADAARQGLSPERYGSRPLESAIRDGYAAAGGAETIAATEIALTDAVLAYVRERTGGVVEPTSVGWMTRTPEPADPAALLRHGLESGDLSGWLDGLAPVRPGYAALVARLEHYRGLAVLPWDEIAAGESIRPGSSDPRVPALRARLEALGDLEPHDPVPLPPVAMGLAAETYDDGLVAAVERFQKRHGLEADGIVGRRTLAALNVTPAQRAATIVANLEKLRWMPTSESLGNRHIEVNVPGYKLVAWDRGRPVLSMAVIVGEPKHPTPIFSDRMVNLKFAPDWTVPFSIARNELLPKIQQDPSWLVTHNYRVISDWGRGIEVSPWSVDWSQVTARNWSYMLQQRPGPASALGLVRFSLTNPQDIYLHDTGSRHLFARALRSLSHGCVRVADPVALAEYALATEPEPWSRERIEAAMNAEETHYQRLAQAVPVHFFYVTAWIDEGGAMQFRNDIYGLDAKVLAALEAAAADPVPDLPLLVSAEADHRHDGLAAIEGGVAEAPL